MIQEERKQRITIFIQFWAIELFLFYEMFFVYSAKKFKPIQIK